MDSQNGLPNEAENEQENKEHLKTDLEGSGCSTRQAKEL